MQAHLPEDLLLRPLRPRRLPLGEDRQSRLPQEGPSLIQPESAPAREKIRAGRNRTLTLLPEEAASLRDRLLRAGDIAPGKAPESILDRTINADFLEIAPRLPRAFVDLLVVDPPYNLTKNFNGRNFRKTDRADYEAYTEAWLDRALPLLKGDASVYVCADWQTSMCLAPVLERRLAVRNRITWQREKGRGASANWKNCTEDIWFATVGSDWYFDLEAVMMKRKVIAPYRADGLPKDWEETDAGRFRKTCPSNFWDDISIPYWSMPENTDHPTQKPEKLLAKLILASCPPGGVVFDPFLGSGTTSVAAKKLGRRFCGVEIDEEFCLWAEKRLALADGDTSIQGYAGGVFWERNTTAEQKRARDRR